MSLIPLNTSQVFSVLFVFLFFWLTWALVLRTALLQPSCKGGNKLREWQNKVEWNPRIAALCYFYVHRFFPSACRGVSNGLALPSSSIMFSAHVNCCGVRVFQRHAVGKVSCQKQACPQLIRRLRDWIWLIKHPPCRHGVCSAAREKKKKGKQEGGKKPRMELEHAPECPDTASPRPPTRCRSLLRFHHLHPCAHPECVLNAGLVPRHCMRSLLQLHLLRVCLFSAYTQVCECSSVGSLKLCGEVWFLPSYMRCVCVRVFVLPCFTCVRVWLLWAGFVCVSVL